jgi:N-acyl-D-amino-acid deacylase
VLESQETGGKIAIDYYADIAVVDLDKIADHATYETPHRYSEGIIHLLVNGIHSIEYGKATAKRGGMVAKRK